jgi:hypothetical protein
MKIELAKALGDVDAPRELMQSRNILFYEWFTTCFQILSYWQLASLILL